MPAAVSLSRSLPALASGGAWLLLAGACVPIATAQTGGGLQLDPPATAAAPAGPAAQRDPAAQTDPFAGLGDDREDILALVEGTSPEELMLRLSLLEAQLSRNGQKFLQRRVLLERYRDDARRSVVTLERIPAVSAAAAVFATDEVRRQLQTLGRLEDSKAKVDGLREALGVDDATLGRLGELLVSREVVAKTEEGLDQIESVFQGAVQDNLPDIGTLRGGGGSSLASVLKILDEIDSDAGSVGPANAGPAEPSGASGDDMLARIFFGG